MNENFLSTLIYALPIAYACHRIITDDSGKPVDYLFLDVNEAFEEMTGLRKDRIAGKKVTEVLPEIRSESFDWISAYGKVAQTGGREQFTQYSPSLRRWYTVTALSPEPGVFVTFFKDISESVATLRQLEDSRKETDGITVEFDTLFAGSQDALFTVVRDGESFRYVKSNPAYQDLTGILPGRLSGKTPAELFGAESALEQETVFRECFRTGKADAFEQSAELPGGRRILQTRLTPVFLGAEIRYLLGTIRDITEFKLLQSEREELLSRLSSMFTSHKAMMLIIEPETGRILDANPSACEFYGYKKEEILRLSISDINTLPRREVEARRRLAIEKKQRNFLFPHRLRNGEVRMVDVYSSPVQFRGKTALFSIIADATEREEFRESLSREKDLLEKTLHSIGDGVVTTDNDGRITMLNDAAQEITGWGNDEAIGRYFTDVFVLRSEETGETVENPIQKVLETGKIVGLANHTELIARLGRRIPIADSAAPIRNENGDTFGVVMVFRDVSRDKKQRDEILYLSYHDPLTGLYNRRFIEEQMQKLDTENRLPLAVIMGDVNGLKITNDVFGHENGDRILQRVSEILVESAGPSDIISRWGGDEFLMLLPNTTYETAEEIIRAVKENCVTKSTSMLQLSVSLGCAVKKEKHEDIQQILQDAEEWMYHQKLLEGKSYRNTIINTLLATLFEKSLETEEHAERLTFNCHAVARRLHISSKEINELSLLSILHDIGKVGVRTEILQKPGPLTEDEWDEMKRHPEIGYRIAQNTPELSVVAEYILSHHERYDGKGYPRGLKGEAIPLLCRILSVADAYDAMTNDRIYRKAVSRDEAVAELQKNAGTQFDPQIVELFVQSLPRH